MTRSQFAFLASCFIFVPILAAQTDRQPGNAFLDVQAPMPPAVARINGQLHLVYELHMTNFSPRTVTLTRIDLLSEHNLLNTYEGDALLSGLSMVGASARTGENPRLEGGHQAIFYVWLLLPQGRIPDEIRHRISFRADDGSNFSTDAAQARIAGQAPVVLGPPLRGGAWVAVYDPSLKNGHRRAMFAIDGKARIPARFAVDWIRLGPDGRSEHDDVSVFSNSYSYGEDVLAVSDGVIAAVEDKFPEPTPNISIDNEAGNFISLDLGGGRFAFYEHLKPGSIRVKIKERVRAGQVLASVGASGSVFSGAHLHFHVADANAPLAAEGLPFVFRSYGYLGEFESFEALSRPWVPPPQKKADERLMDTPAPLAVVKFQ
jgi:Peptidase family M23